MHKPDWIKNKSIGGIVTVQNGIGLNRSTPSISICRSSHTHTYTCFDPLLYTIPFDSIPFNAMWYTNFFLSFSVQLDITVHSNILVFICPNPHNIKIVLTLWNLKQTSEMCGIETKEDMEQMKAAEKTTNYLGTTIRFIFPNRIYHIQKLSNSLSLHFWKVIANFVREWRYTHTHHIWNSSIASKLYIIQ